MLNDGLADRDQFPRELTDPAGLPGRVNDLRPSLWEDENRLFVGVTTLEGFPLIMTDEAVDEWLVVLWREAYVVFCREEDGGDIGPETERCAANFDTLKLFGSRDGG